MPDKGNLAAMILEKARAKEGDGEDYGQIARREAGDALLTAIQNGDGEKVAEAIQNLYQVSSD